MLKSITTIVGLLCFLGALSGCGGGDDVNSDLASASSGRSLEVLMEGSGSAEVSVQKMPGADS